MARQRLPCQRHGPAPRRRRAVVDGIEIVHPVQANGVFARLHPRHIAALQENWTFHVWDEGDNVVRWMTAFDTTEADVDAFLRDIRSTAVL